MEREGGREMNAYVCRLSVHKSVSSVGMPAFCSR